MKFVHMDTCALDRQIDILKGLKRLTETTYTRRCLKPGHGLTADQLCAASLLQYAPHSTSFNYLSKSTIEHIMGQYVSQADVTAAAEALGIRIRNGCFDTSRAFIRALDNLMTQGIVVSFDPAKEKARTA